MARSRNIKPGFYKNEDLAECSVWARLLFPGLWMLADREGRLEDRPKRIKGEIFPFDSVEVEPLIVELVRWGFVLRYEKDGARYIQILNFSKHQRPHSREKDSVIPPPDGYQAPPNEDPDIPEAQPRHNLGNAEAQPRQCRARSDSLIPDSLIPEYPLPSVGGAGGAQPSLLSEPHDASPSAPPPGKAADLQDQANPADGLFAEETHAASDPPKPDRQRRGSRMFAGWLLPKAWGEWALAEQPTWTPEHVRWVADNFRDYWLSATGKGATKADWEATWRTWVRKESPLINGARASPGQRGRRSLLTETGMIGACNER